MISDTILFVTRSSGSTDRWSAILDTMAENVVYASELSLTLSIFDSSETEIVLVEAIGNAEADIGLIRRLHLLLDHPILIIAENASEEFTLALYDAGVDECISGKISSALLQAKINAWLRWQRRPKRMPRSKVKIKELTQSSIDQMNQ